MTIDVVVEQPIKVFENNAPLLVFQARKLTPAGLYIPYLLDAAHTDDIFFYAKNSRNDPDGSAAFVYSLGAGAIVITDDGGGVGDLHSEFTVQFTATDIDTVANYFYHIDNMKSGRADTIRFGYLEVVNT